MEFLHGRPMTNASLGESGMPSRIGATLRVLHGGPRFLRDFDMLGLAEGYRVVTERRGFPVPSGYGARRPTVQRIGGVLAVRPLPAVPCHDDLLADNFMIVSDVGWALWAAIQTTISRIAFDFEAYGAARWARAEVAMDFPDFPRWLEAVTQPDAAGST